MNTVPNAQDILTYEQRLRLDRSWSMDEGDRHFQHDSLDKYLELWQGIRESPVGPVEPWPE
ncbi:MAG TPA: hypothetical protein VKA15_15050 [Isosphaeraceae bacterium]|nr:hypothetical protein [Isosphaeraceae bacterium]